MTVEIPALRENVRRRARATAPITRRTAATDRERTGEAIGTNPAYVAWLLARSMLADATEISRQFSGQATMWHNSFAEPGPRRAVETASVWFTAYPISFITRPGESFLAALADVELWSAFARIGIEAVHTGPVKRAGGIDGWRTTPSVDGYFDRTSTEIDPTFGTEAEFRTMCEMAGWFGGTIIDDIVPGHTGKGADFRLAEMAYGDYPGIYHMIEIDRADWGILPEVRPDQDSVNVDVATEELLTKAGYIIGRLQRVIFYTEGVKETNWSVTRPVVGVDGVTRRWVYLHYFKDGQPSINWLDPSFAGNRLVMGDALHSLTDLGAGALRLDANGFLGIEKGDEGRPAWSEGHPLSAAANHLIGSMVRKLGGFTFQELNLTIDDIRATAAGGADLSYDFVNRPAYHHALATGDTEFLRLTLRTSLELGVDPASLVHGMQNHDELTYELLHWADGHRDDVYAYRGAAVTGAELAESVRRDLCDRLTGPAAPYNQIFTTNGIACTTATVIAATLGITDLATIDAADVERIRRAHLLLVMFNALQPGVIALSGWDLCGMLTLPPDTVGELIADGDTRWLNRAAHDLMGADPTATASPAGIPRGTSLYGTLPAQLDDETSFASSLAAVLAVRSRFGIAVSDQLDVPDVGAPGLLVMVNRLDALRLHVAVLNFAAEPVRADVRSAFLTPGHAVSDMLTDQPVSTVDGRGGFALELGAHEGRSLLVAATDLVSVASIHSDAAVWGSGEPAGTAR